VRHVATTRALPRVVVSVLLLVSLAACGEEPQPTDGQVEGKRMGGGLAQHISTSAAWTAPYRCSRFSTNIAGPNVEGVTWNSATKGLQVQPFGPSAKFATIADARAEGSTDIGPLERLRDSLNEQHVDVLVTLGGLGTDGASIERVLAALTTGADYLVLAMPGDRESFPAHRLAVASLAKRGMRILDASRYRLTQIGGLRLVTMPGISKASHLIAGDDGCLHTDADVKDLRSSLAQSSAPTILLSYAPWRQQGESATDLGIGGVHTGEIALTPLRDSGAVSALIHGMLTSEGQVESGNIRLVQPPSSISSGSVSVDAPEPSALLLSVAGAKLSWKRLPVH